MLYREVNSFHSLTFRNTSKPCTGDVSLIFQRTKHGRLFLSPRPDVSRFKFEGKTFYVIGVQREVSYVTLLSL